MNELLTAAPSFQFFFSIVDGDIERSEPDPISGERLFRLPVYHVENSLLNEEHILRVTMSMLGAKCPFKTADDVSCRLRESLLYEVHLKPFTKALLDSKLSALAKGAYDAVYSPSATCSQPVQRPEYSSVEQDARAILTEAIKENSWKAKCKGRDLLRAYCGPLGLKYEHFRNCLISDLGAPPQGLSEIMRKILA